MLRTRPGGRAATRHKFPDWRASQTARNRKLLLPADNCAESSDSDPSTLPRRTGPTTFHREEWTHFRSLATIGQRAGVTRDRLPRLVVKELVDNAFDEAGECKYGLMPGTGAGPDGGIAFYVEDRGSGISGTDDQVV